MAKDKKKTWIEPEIIPLEDVRLKDVASSGGMGTDGEGSIPSAMS